MEMVEEEEKEKKEKKEEEEKAKEEMGATTLLLLLPLHLQALLNCSPLTKVLLPRRKFLPHHRDGRKRSVGYLHISLPSSFPFMAEAKVCEFFFAFLPLPSIS
jgi:hypothetical protein